MLTGIIIVSILIAVGLCCTVVLVIGMILNIKKNNEKIRAYVIKLVVISLSVFVLGGINAALIIKYLYENKDKVF